MTRILLISYYFPPCGGAAVQRWVKLLPELAKQDADIHVLTTSGGDYPETDETLLQTIPPQVRIHRTPAPSVGNLWKIFFGSKLSMPYGNLGYQQTGSVLAKLFIWMRLNLIIPDMRVFWNRRALSAAMDILRSNRFDVVVTTGPPHSTHLIGMALKKSTGIRWIADWRDPWSEVYYFKLNPPTAISRSIHKMLETKVCGTADLNIMVSRHLAQSLPTGSKMVLYNGFDAAAYPITENMAVDNVFRIKYVGKITAGQDMDSLLDILRQITGTTPIQISFVGTMLSDEMISRIRDIPELDLRIIPFIPHRNAIAEMMHSDLLILFINYYPGHEGMLTSKLFEYLGTGHPVLGLGPHGGEAEELIGRYRAGAYFDHQETTQAAEYLRGLISEKSDKPSMMRQEDIGVLSSQSQALRLWEILNTQKK